MGRDGNGGWVIASQSNALADSLLVKDILMKLASVEGSPAIRSKQPIADAGSEKIRLESRDRVIELAVDRQKAKTTVSSNGGYLVYGVDEWPRVPQLNEIVDSGIFPSSSSEFLSFSFKTWAPAVREKNYTLDTPQSRALLAILKNNPRAERWLSPVEEKKLGVPQGQLELVLREKSFVIDLWRGPIGWVGRVGGRSFETGKDLNSFIDTVASL